MSQTPRTLGRKPDLITSTPKGKSQRPQKISLIVRPWRRRPRNSMAMASRFMALYRLLSGVNKTHASLMVALVLDSHARHRAGRAVARSHLRPAGPSSAYRGSRRSR